MRLKRFRQSGPFGLLGALLAVITIEAAFARHDLDLNRPENLNWKRGRATASRQAVKADILCMGSSMVQTGLLPKVIAERSGRPTYGLAVVGAQMPYNYFAFKQAVASGAKPSALVIDFPVNFLCQDFEKTTAAWPDALNVRELVDLGWNLRDSQFFASVLSEKLLPSLAYRLQVRKVVMANLRGESLSMKTDNLVSMRNHNKNDGAFVAGKRPGYGGEVSEAFRLSFLSDAPWKTDPVKVRYFRKLIDLAASNNVRVFWVMSPFVPTLQEGRDRKKLDVHYNAFAWAMVSKFPNLTVLDARHADYKADVFMDAVHLDVDGARALSVAVADAIENDLGSSTWVNLPPYRERHVNAPIELAADSYRAVFPGGAVRR